MKRCACCKSEQPHSQFFKHSQTPDGLHSWCKVCCSIGNRNSRAKRDSTISGKARTFLQNAKKSAAQRGQEFRLTVADIESCWEQQGQLCAYSGRKMVLESGHMETVSIERIDSSVGYVPENTILVCYAVNRMKSNFKLLEFFKMCRDVHQFLSDDAGRFSIGDSNE